MSRVLPRSDGFDSPRRIYDYLDRFVIGQERAKRALSVAAYGHVRRLAARDSGEDVRLEKSNVLLIGPTGCGKTHLARNLAAALSVPFTVCDATEYTEAGYYGKDVEVMVAELLFSCEGDVEATQRGIVFIDEVDKIARRSHGARTGAGSRDIGGEGVQQGLLKLLEGREIFVPLNVTQHWNKHDFVQVDTTEILFICAGTFSDLHLYGGPKRAGFTADGAGTDAPRRQPGRITQRELLDYGLLAEFLGRLPVRVQLSELGPDELARILTEPPDALLKEYERRLALDRVKLEVTPAAIAAIAEFAVTRGTGARGLRAVIEELLEPALFEGPELSDREVVLDADEVRARLASLPKAP